MSGDDPSVIELFPELATFRDIVYLSKAMMAPHTEHLPAMAAWTPADARLAWRFKEGDGKEKPGYFIIKGFGADMKANGWVDANGDPREKRQTVLHSARATAGPGAPELGSSSGSCSDSESSSSMEPSF